MLIQATKYRPGSDFIDYESVKPESFGVIAKVVRSVIDDVGEPFWQR